MARHAGPRSSGACSGSWPSGSSEHADDLARLDSLDTGNPITAMRADLIKGIRSLTDAAGLALEIKGEVFPLPGLHYTQREPWGVVGRMITFNHPAMFTCARLGAALVAGNTVVLKPSELAPLSTLAIAELTAGLLPDGVVNAVVGGPGDGRGARAASGRPPPVVHRQHRDGPAHPALGRRQRSGEDAVVRARWQESDRRVR